MEIFIEPLGMHPWLIVLGAALDTMDGRIARFIGNDSKFGIEFDSLADVCTFGIAPALMVYRESLNSSWGVAIAFAFLLCGALRLARYNLLSQWTALVAVDDTPARVAC